MDVLMRIVGSDAPARVLSLGREHVPQVGDHVVIERDPSGARKLPPETYRVVRRDFHFDSVVDNGKEAFCSATSAPGERYAHVALHVELVDPVADVEAIIQRVRKAFKP